MNIFKILSSLLCLIHLNCLGAELYRSDEELIDYLAVTNDNRELHVLYSIGPIALKKGDIIDVRVQAVVSSECKGNVGIGRYITRTRGTLITQGNRVTKGVMSNLTINDHHAVLVHSGIERIEYASHENYYNFVVFAQSTQCEKEMLKVEGVDNDGFGELIVLVH